jgi:hypothetical protein
MGICCDGEEVVPDPGGNDTTSLAEAHVYAVAWDSRPESPQYEEQPAGQGDRAWAGCCDAELAAVPLPVDRDRDRAVVTVPFGLAQNSPNPFEGSTEIAYTLSEPAHVDLGVFSVSGRRIKTLIRQYQATGHKITHWDGRDESGAEVTGGIYFCRLEAGHQSRVWKIAVLR